MSRQDEQAGGCGRMEQAGGEGPMSATGSGSASRCEAQRSPSLILARRFPAMHYPAAVSSSMGILPPTCGGGLRGGCGH